MAQEKQDNDEKSSSAPVDETDEYEYPSGIKLLLVMISIFTAMFLVALDKLIISTATPSITNDFHSANDIGWYGTAYLLTNCAFLLVFGKIYNIFDVKATFLTAVVLFEIGSAICGAAPDSIAFIIGRAIAGLGAGGVQSGIFAIIAYALPLHKRPQYQGIFGAMFGIASLIGPLVGGAFTSDVTWRWCFYINLPFGAIVFAFVFFLLKIPDKSLPTETLKHKLQQLNFEGLLALLPGVVCLCLALQWGGFTYSWSNGRIIALLVIASVLLIVFILIQVWQPQRAMVPPRIFTQRSIASGFWVSCCIGAHQTIIIYFLSVWFQAIKGNTAVKSGIHQLPLTMAVVVSSILAGGLTRKVGYYTPFLICGICLTTIGMGLITTLGIHASQAEWACYQFLYGFGLGCSVMAPNLAAQTVLLRRDVSIGASLMLFAQSLFGAIFASVGENILDGQLAKRLGNIASISAEQIESAGVTGVFDIIPEKDHAAATLAYNESLRVVFQVGLTMACLSVIGGFVMEWRSVKEEENNKATEPPDSEQGAGDGGAACDISDNVAKV